ncbi:MAG: hypothetical protein ACREL7_10815 [Longimicrobiales bacterium]
MHSTRWRSIVSAAWFFFFAKPVFAQLLPGADVTIATQSVWRGLTRVSDPVLQPSAYLALGIGTGFLSAGVWADYEFGTGPGDYSLAGIGKADIGSVEAWVEYAARQSLFDWKAGYVRSRLRNDMRIHGVPPELATSELYLGVTSRRLPVVASLTAWQDVDELQGRYFLLDVAYPLPTNPLGEIAGSIFAGARAGLANGLERDSDHADRPYYFEESGLSHAELYLEWSFELPVSWLPLDLFLSPHYEFAIDEAAQRRSPDPLVARRKRFFWFELAASLRFELAGSSTSS